MTTLVKEPCALCSSPSAGSGMRFAYRLPEGERSRYDGAEAVVMDLSFCAACASKAFKHTKRFFGTRFFRGSKRSSGSR